MPQSNLIERSQLIKNHGNKSWEGFIWYDDSKSPEVFKGELLDFEKKLSNLPFVLEGMLIDTEKNFSLTITHNDTGYQILESTDFKEEQRKIKYLASDRFDIKGFKLVFLPYFERVPDEISTSGFHEQRFSHFIFMGFEDAETQEDEPSKIKENAR